MIRTALRLATFRPVSWAEFAFPGVQTALIIVWFTVLSVLPVSLSQADLEEIGLARVPLGVVSLPIMFASLALGAYIVERWLRRGGRWDGSGSMMNVYVVSAIVPSTAYYGLLLLGVEHTVIALLLSLAYGAATFVHAVSCLIPQARSGYVLAGYLFADLAASATQLLMMLGVSLVAHAIALSATAALLLPLFGVS